MAFFLQIVFAGLADGCAFALIALGFSIIFKASGVINFAQGEFLLVGVYVVWAAIAQAHLNFFVAALVGIAATVLIGVLFERFVLRRMIGRPVFSIIMITIGLDVLLLTLVTISFNRTLGTAGLATAPTPFGFASGIQLGGVTFGSNAIWTIIITVLICAALYVFFRFTRYGLAMRATAIDQEVALAMGIKISTVYTLAWGIAGAIATIGGICVLGATSSPAFDLGLGQTALVAFPAIILGGLDSIPGAVVGGVVIGLVYELTAAYELPYDKFLGTNFYEIAPYLVMILVLLIRPYGLFGTRKVERL